ncbi:MAG: hypothetical protein OEU36_22860, partial [Gammaproteobacteria bacterium]|nr:hypothetical protein [Gammaproteobacteria bacterium]
GFPQSWIYDDEQDRAIFKALERRISKNTESNLVKTALAEGRRPSLITVAGQPIQVQGVQLDWPQEQRCAYLAGHPILYCFDVRRTGKSDDQTPSMGKAGLACTLGDLETWLEQEKTNRKFVVGTIAIGLMSIALLAVRLSIQ